MTTKTWSKVIKKRLETCRKNQEAGIDCDECVLELEENCVCLDCTQDCGGCDKASNFVSVPEES